MRSSSPSRKQVRIADHAAFAAAERNVDHGAFPGHPGSQRAHFVQRHVGRKADAALGGAARDGMLHAIAGEDFEPAVVELHRNVTVISLAGERSTLHMPSSSLRRAAASSKRAAAASQGFISLSTSGVETVSNNMADIFLTPSLKVGSFRQRHFSVRQGTDMLEEPRTASPSILTFHGSKLSCNC